MSLVAGRQDHRIRDPQSGPCWIVTVPADDGASAVLTPAGISD
jgi:hypothetical protein